MTTFPTGDHDFLRLARTFDDVFAAELMRWAQRSNSRVRLAVPPRVQRGGTGAVVAVIELTALSAPGSQTRRIVKVYPEGDPAARTGDGPDMFAAVPTEFAERHLVRESSRHRTESGRWFAFQEIHFDLSEALPLALVDPEHRPAVATYAAELVLLDLNQERRVGTAPTHHYLRTELRGALDPGHEVRARAERAGLLDREARWITFAGDDQSRILPNPVAMAMDGLIVAGHELNYLIGFCHGDYHQGNILARVTAHGKPRLDDTRMIDLNTFEAGAPISRDIATLALSLVKDVVRGPLVPGADASLIALLLNPEDTAVRPQVAPYVVEAVRGVYGAFRALPPSLQELWRPQYLLSVVAQALIHTSYEDAGPDGQWWYARLAAHAADEFLRAGSIAAPIDFDRVRRIARPGTTVFSQSRRDPAGKPPARDEGAAANIRIHATDLTGRLTLAVNRLAGARSADDLRTRSRSPRLLAAQLDELLRSVTLPRFEPDVSLEPRMATRSRYEVARSCLDRLNRLVRQTEAGTRLGVGHAELLTEAARAIHTNVVALLDSLGDAGADG